MQTTINPKIESRIRKLLALAERGEGGEKVNAQSALDKMLKKYNLTLEHFLDETSVVEYSRGIRSKNERRLLCQIINMICGKGIKLKATSNRRTIFCQCTESQCAEINLTFEVLQKAWLQEIDLAFSAFIYANDIFPEQTEEDSTEESNLSPEEMRKLERRILAIEKTCVHKRIT